VDVALVVAVVVAFHESFCWARGRKTRHHLF
jgi:hypothetical protein